MTDIWQFAVLGLASGSGYALLALGVVALYRGSGVLNFAHGAVGMVGAYAFWAVFEGGDGDLSPFLSLLVGIAVGAALGGLTYVLVFRHLIASSELTKVVATLGVLAILQGLAVNQYGIRPKFVPRLFGSGSVDVLGAPLSQDAMIMLAATFGSALGLSFLFNRTRIGATAVALRERPEAASMLGVSPHPTGLLLSIVAGALGALGGILLLPFTGLSPTQLTLLVIPGLAAGLVGRFQLIWATAAVGLAIGVVESSLVGAGIDPLLTKAVPFVAIIVVLTARGQSLPGRGSGALMRMPRLGDGRLRAVPTLGILAGVFAICLFGSASWATAMTSTAIAGMIALSIVIVTGFAGQVSLAPLALAGISSLVVARLNSDWGWGFLPATVGGVVAATAAGLLIGAPAVRVRGVNLAIATLGLALLVEQTVLTSPWLTGGITGLPLADVSIFGVSFDPGSHGDRYALLSGVMAAMAVFAVANIRRSAVGRRFAAVRADERGAAALGVSVPGAKLGAFAMSAAVAGLAGALITFRYQVAVFENFGVFGSINALTLTVVAGVGMLLGGIAAGVLGAGGLLTYLISGVFGWHAIDPWMPVFSGLLVLQVMLLQPDGLMAQGRSFMEKVRGGSQGMSAGRAAERPPAPAELERLSPNGIHAGTPVITVDRLTVRYGATTAVSEFDLVLRAGEVVGVIGPNGAGKTTLIDALTGFAPATEGSVMFLGEPITRRRPHQRSRLGLGRTFQDLALFEDLSVRENLLTGMDRSGSLAYLSAPFRAGSRELSPDTMIAVRSFDLERHIDTTVSDLPQGMRRMVAIARAAAASPAVICLDEPAAGMTTLERRAASRLIRSLADELGAAVLLVEHDIDMVADVCDHVVVLDFGKQIAAGTPAEVLARAAVRMAYLGEQPSRKHDEELTKESGR